MNRVQSIDSSGVVAGPVLPEESGVYQITHEAAPGCFYVGQAQNIQRRINGHLTQLLQGVHHNSRLRKLVKKHGVGGLRFKVLELCPVSDLARLEEHWIDLLNPTLNGNKGGGTGRRRADAEPRDERRVKGTTIYIDPSIRARIEAAVAADPDGANFNYYACKFIRWGLERFERKQAGKQAATPTA